MRVAITAACWLAFLLPASAGPAQDPGKFFDDECAMCHTIGGEPAGGPDLKDIAARRDRRWLLRFIRDPEEAAEHDRDAAALVKQYDNAMPATQGASRELLEAVIDYIQSRSATAAVTSVPPTPPPERAIAPEDVAAGRELYVGGRPTANGAPACIACHRLSGLAGMGGGALGPDLTATVQRLGTRGLNTWLANPPTPVMRAIYRPTPLTAGETHALAAYIASVADAAPAGTRVPLLVAGGAFGMLTVFIAIGVTWSRRFRGVRRTLIARAAGGHR